MLFKVQYQGKKKYIKLNGASYPEFLNEAKAKFSIPTEKNVYVVDDTGTEVDEEVFSDILEEKSDILWTIIDVPSVTDSPAPSMCTDTLSLSSQSEECDLSLMSPKRPHVDDAFLMSPKRQHIDDSSSQAKELVKRVLEQKPGGEKILKEYYMRGEMKDRTRCNLVNIVVADMVEKYGRAPPMDKRTQYALGIVTLFPSLKDPYSKKGYEHFFDADSNEGYIAWKLKNTQQELSGAGTIGVRKNSSRTSNGSGPELEREVTEEQQLEGDQCREAISLLKHSPEIEQICMKMRATFKHRQKLIHDPEQCSTVLTVFPRFLDTKGLVLQDFDLLFGAETSSKLLEKWGTLLKAKVMEQAKTSARLPILTTSSSVQRRTMMRMKKSQVGRATWTHCYCWSTFCHRHQVEIREL
ncbi:Glycerol-3-phosphate acyltransferase [Dissostichus eleginoides]|uniref:Glycerol-3-phosphate acyltransferase n=1 Tax=Dissostichus eleginoides TaxID=100907 RepID=A0AAD9C9P9_DISEL|nr:Glycerol-3-phosphate acyltransferase [Dissostichus eleginoides]